MNDPGRAVPGATRPLGGHPFPDDNAPLFTVGQVAEMLAVQPAFLRRLDAMDVVRPSRSGGGQRRYSRREIDQIYTLHGLMDEGLTVAGAQRILLMQAEIDALRRQVAELQQQQQQQ